MTLIGTAVFSVLFRGEWHDIELNAGDILLFDQDIKHKAGPAQGVKRYGMRRKTDTACLFGRHGTHPRGRG